MAKRMKDSTVYSKDGFVGNTTTDITIDKGSTTERKESRKYDYPVLRPEMIIKQHRERILAACGGDDDLMKVCCEFGFRNKFANVIQSRIRSALTAPSVKTINDRLNGLFRELFGKGDMEAAKKLDTEIKAAKGKDALIALYRTWMKIGE